MFRKKNQSYKGFGNPKDLREKIEFMQNPKVKEMMTGLIMQMGGSSILGGHRLKSGDVQFFLIPSDGIRDKELMPKISKIIGFICLQSDEWIDDFTRAMEERVTFLEKEHRHDLG